MRQEWKVLLVSDSGAFKYNFLDTNEELGEKHRYWKAGFSPKFFNDRHFDHTNSMQFITTPHAVIKRPSNHEKLGFLINVGSVNIRLRYYVNTAENKDTDCYLKNVGPTTDILLPMNAKEVGIGPNVYWLLY